MANRSQPNPEDLLKMLVSQMAMDNMPNQTIFFFRQIYPVLRVAGGMSQTEMAELASMTPSGAKAHITKLTKAGFLIRKNYKTWILPLRLPITDPLLLTIARSL